MDRVSTLTSFFRAGSPNVIGQGVTSKEPSCTLTLADLTLGAGALEESWEPNREANGRHKEVD